MFIIVEFSVKGSGSGRDYAVVPLSWFHCDTVKWNKTRKFAVNSTPPQPSWPSYPAKMAKNTTIMNSFEVAEGELDRILAEESTTDESEAETQKRISLKRKDAAYAYSTDECDDIEDPLADFDAPPPKLTRTSEDTVATPNISSSLTHTSTPTIPLEITCVRQDELATLIKEIQNLTTIMMARRVSCLKAKMRRSRRVQNSSTL